MPNDKVITHHLGRDYIGLDNPDEETEGSHISYPKNVEPLKRPQFAFPVGVVRKGFSKEAGKRWILPDYAFVPPGIRPIDFAEEKIKTVTPDIWRMMYPRVIQGAEKYHSARHAATMLSLAAYYPRLMGSDFAPTTYRLMMPSLKAMVDQRVPLKYISPDLLKAIRDCNEYKTKIDWQELELPAEQGVFMLPKGTITHPIDGEVAFIFYARQKAGPFPLVTPDGNGLRTGHLEGDRFVFTVACPYSPNLVWYDSNITKENRPEIEFGNVFWDTDPESRERKYQEHGGNNLNYDWPLDRGDAEFIEEVGKILFGTLIALEAEPTLLESSSRQLRVVKGKKGKSDLDIWSPHIIGEKYKYQPLIGPHGTHSAPRWHWRSAHWRMQPCGPGGHDRKRIRIKSMEVSKALRPILYSADYERKEVT